MKKVMHVHTVDELKTLVEQNNFVVVDFFATWCGPCKMLTPHFEQMATDRTDIVFVKVDVDDAPELAESHSISAMPTIMFYKNGSLLTEHVLGADIEKIKHNINRFFT